MNADDSEVEAGTYALTVRYWDVYDSNTYFDHMMTIVVVPPTSETTARQTIEAIPEDTCF